MFRIALMLLAVAAAALPGSPARAVPIVHTTDFIPDSERTAFNGFESLQQELISANQMSEDGIRVEHVGEFDDVWTLLGSQSRVGFEGTRSWYPESVDGVTGYDRITLVSGGDFESIGMLVGTGFGGYCTYDCDEVAPYLTLYYEVLDQGTVVASGSLPHHPNAHFVGFSGGGFDEVRLWDADSFYPDRTALILDAIELSEVPEPGTSWLVAAGLAFLGARRRFTRNV